MSSMIEQKNDPAAIEVVLPDLQKLRVEIPLPAETDVPSLSARLAKIQLASAQSQKVNRPLRPGDYAVLDIFATVLSVPIAGDCQQGIRVRIPDDKHSLLGKLVGMKPMETRNLIHDLPADYPYTGWRGVKASYRIKLHAVEALILPALDDHLAKLSGKGQTLAELEARLQQDKQTEANTAWQQKVLHLVTQKVVEESQINIPDALLEARLKAVWSATEATALSQSKIPEPLLQKAFEVWSQREDVLQTIRDALGEFLVFQALIKREAFIITETDLLRFLGLTAERFNLEPQQSLEVFRQSGQLSQLESRLLKLQIQQFLCTQVQLSHQGEVLKTDSHSVNSSAS